MDELCWSSVIYPNPDLKRKFESMDGLFSDEMKKLRNGDFGYLYDEDNSGRLNLLFLLLRTESYFRLNISPEDFLSLLSND